MKKMEGKVVCSESVEKESSEEAKEAKSESHDSETNLWEFVQ